MLLRFGVENFLSFRERQEFSLVATSLSGSDAGLKTLPGAQERRILPAALVYGPNASGKSNLVAALRFMATAIDQSHRSGDPQGGVPRTPFALAKDATETDTALDIDLVLDGVRYHYGFRCNDKEFTSEWLYSFPQGTRRKLFDRSSATEIAFGPSLKGPKIMLKTIMRPNSLFLSAAAQNNHPVLGQIAAYFNRIQFNGDIAVEPPAIVVAFKNREIDERAIKLLQELGTGVVGMDKQTKALSDKEKLLRREMLSVVAKFVGQDLVDDDEDYEQTTIRLIHKGANGAEVPFDLDRESSGTRRLLVLVSSLFAALDKGHLVVIDELDASLHTQAAEIILAMFANETLNPHGAQLLATTHDTNLLMAEFLRRDEVWFVEKDGEGESHLYPLSDFQIRAGDNIERGYMQGRFGAIPFSGDVTSWLKSHLETNSLPRP